MPQNRRDISSPCPRRSDRCGHDVGDIVSSDGFSRVVVTGFDEGQTHKRDASSEGGITALNLIFQPLYEPINGCNGVLHLL